MINNVKVLFFNALSIIDDAETLFTRQFGELPSSAAAHVGFGADIPDAEHGLYFEAVLRGVEQTLLTNALKVNEGLLEIITIPLPSVINCLDWAQSQKGRPYDISLIVREGAIAIMPSDVPQMESPNRYICSTFVLDALLHGGLIIPPSLAGKGAWVTPEALRDSLRDYPGATSFMV